MVKSSTLGHNKLTEPIHWTYMINQTHPSINAKPLTSYTKAPPPQTSTVVISILESILKNISMTHMSNGLNLLHPRKDVAEMVIVFCVSLIVPEDLMFAIKSGEHVYQESSFFVSPLSFLRVSWWYQVSMSWCNCSKMSEALAGAHMNSANSIIVNHIT